MMRKSGGGAGGKKKQPDPIDEVEELLRVAQDDLLLKLNVNSHLKSKSNSKFNSDLDLETGSSQNNSMDPELERRFQALLSKPSRPKPKPVAADATADHEDINVDNLFARFAALKAAAAAAAAATSTSSSEETMKVVKENHGVGDFVEDEDEDEVSKIIKWAIDAARLDPSPSSDIKDDDDGSEKDDESNDDTDDDDVNCKKKGWKK